MSTTPPTDELVVWISGDSAETLTLSATPATFRSMFTSTAVLMLTITPLKSYGVKPASSARRSYVPTGSAFSRYTPSASVTSVRVKPVLALLAVTVTPGTAAFCASTIRP